MSFGCNFVALACMQLVLMDMWCRNVLFDSCSLEIADAVLVDGVCIEQFAAQVMLECIA